jgi:hypothetical protein
VVEPQHPARCPCPLCTATHDEPADQLDEPTPKPDEINWCAFCGHDFGRFHNVPENPLDLCLNYDEDVAICFDCAKAAYASLLKSRELAAKAQATKAKKDSAEEPSLYYYVYEAKRHVLEYLSKLYPEQHWRLLEELHAMLWGLDTVERKSTTISEGRMTLEQLEELERREEQARIDAARAKKAKKDS